MTAETPASASSERRLEVRDLHKSYAGPGGSLDILAGVSFTLEAGAAMAVTGPSGSGKSTLLYVLGALEPPTSGSVLLDGRDPFRAGERELAAFRNRHVGFVFQDHGLLPQCSALENVLIPTLVTPGDRSPHVARARELLEAVGLADRLRHRPGELSGGERQRVAVARALILAPGLVLCDEPTGSLDRRAAQDVAELLLELNRRLRTILIVVTHSVELADRFPLRRELRDGSLLAV